MSHTRTVEIALREYTEFAPRCSYCRVTRLQLEHPTNACAACSWKMEAGIPIVKFERRKARVTSRK